MEDKTYKIPPLAHFIWAGGTKLMVPEGIDIVSRWAKANENVNGFRACLWVDKTTAGKSLEDLVREYKELFAKNGITVLEETESKSVDITKIKPPPLIIRDIGRLRDEYVAYEIDKLRPNYGSSSDILRYQILLREGGLYGDCSDVDVGPDGLEKIFAQNFKKHALFLEHRPQQPQASQQNLETFELRQLGNDTFIATAPFPLNPALKRIVEMCRQNYELPEQLGAAHIFVAHSGNNIKDITIGRTGPGLVRQTLLREMKCQQVEGILLDEKKEVEIHRVRNGTNLSLVTPNTNTGNWLNTRITRYEDQPELALQAVINTIKFEATHFKILRLDDHINDIVASTGGKIKSREALEHITPIIKENQGKIKYTQLTGQLKETMEYAAVSALTNIFHLTTQGCIAAIKAQAYLNDIITAEQYAIANREQITASAIEQGITEECWAVVTQRPEVQKNLCLQIVLGVEFFGNLSKHLDQFKSYGVGEEVKKYLAERLQKYKEYATALNERVPAENKVNIEKIDELLFKITQNKSLIQEMDAKSKLSS
jgi:hypothetical protein